MKTMSCIRATLIVMSLFIFLPGCQKLFDYIKDNPAEPKKYCKVKKLKKWFYGSYREINFMYNAAGNPTDMLVEDFGAPGGEPDFEFHFRYDKYNRLTDHLMNLKGALGLFVWHRYSYPNKQTIVDTSFHYSGLVTDVIPPNVNTAYSYSAYVYDLDTRGRIVKSTEYFHNEYGTPPFVIYYSYDAQGNRIVPDVVYDNKVNPYRTNPVWSLIYWDYSLNNPLYAPDQIVSYNEWGLPEKLMSPYPYYPSQGQIFGHMYDSVKIEYHCTR